MADLMSFEPSETHFVKDVIKHPERDMEDRVPVIEKEVLEQISDNLSRPPSARKSTIPSLDLAT